MSVYVFDAVEPLIHRPLLPPIHQPAGLARDLKWLLSKNGNGDSVIVLPHAPTGWTRDDMVKAIEDVGWRTQPTDGAWFTAIPETTGNHSTVHIGIREWMAADDPIAGVTRSPAHVAGLLSRWYSVAGTHYRHNPGAATVVSIRKALADRHVTWRLQDLATVEWWPPPANIGDLRRHGNSRPAPGAHRWDMRSAYLAAAAAVDLPAGRLKPTGDDIDPLTAVGYFRIKLGRGDWPSTFLGRDRQGCAWVCHPLMRWLWGRKAGVEIIDSVTASLGTRLLRPWAERWRDGIAENPVLAPALKAGYSQAIGLFNVRGGTIYRPDWRAAIIDQVRYSMIRRIGSVKRLCDLMPARVDIDSVWYVTANDAERDRVGEALGVGPNIGKMRYEGTQFDD